MSIFSDENQKVKKYGSTVKGTLVTVINLAIKNIILRYKKIFKLF